MTEPPPETSVPPNDKSAEAEGLRPLSQTRRVVLVCFGCGFVALAGLGVMLPVLPTTPFLLLASACFIRSSPRLNAWLLRSHVFGPFLRDWHRYHGVRLPVKITAVAMLVAAVTASLLLGNLSWPLRGLLIALAVIGLVVVLRLRTIRPEDEHTSDGQAKPQARSGDTANRPNRRV